MKKTETIQIIVATHKPYEMPGDPVYLPLLVGAANNQSIWNEKKDNEGENISEKNHTYCELTGLYWAWKNLDADYIGLVHYRRFFANSKVWRKKKDRIIAEDELCAFLRKTDVLLPKPRHYLIETNYSQYAHAHHARDLDFAREIIKNRYPHYLSAFDIVMKKRSGHRFNMLVMKKTLLDQYCFWLFDILAELEKKTEIVSYNSYDQRVFGFVGERLLDVWLEKNQVLYQDVPFIFLEKQNWLKKGTAFIRRKMAGKGNGD